MCDLALLRARPPSRGDDFGGSVTERPPAPSPHTSAAPILLGAPSSHSSTPGGQAARVGLSTPSAAQRGGLKQPHIARRSGWLASARSTRTRPFAPPRSVSSGTDSCLRRETNRIDGVDEVLRRVARPVQLNRPLGGAAGQRRVP